MLNENEIAKPAFSIFVILLIALETTHNIKKFNLLCKGGQNVFFNLLQSVATPWIFI